jgi:hypothetical protein
MFSNEDASTILEHNKTEFESNMSVSDFSRTFLLNRFSLEQGGNDADRVKAIDYIKKVLKRSLFVKNKIIQNEERKSIDTM